MAVVVTCCLEVALCSTLWIADQVSRILAWCLWITSSTPTAVVLLSTHRFAPELTRCAVAGACQNNA